VTIFTTKNRHYLKKGRGICQGRGWRRPNTTIITVHHQIVPQHHHPSSMHSGADLASDGVR